MPTLRPGDGVVLDNLMMHNQPEVQAVERVGTRIRFLAPAVAITLLFSPTDCRNFVALRLPNIYGV